MQEQTIPISVLVKGLSAEVRRPIMACIRVVDSMYRDYHDTKAHPQMSLDDHIESCQLSEQDADSVRNCLKLRGYRSSELIAAGAPAWLLKQLGIIRKDGTVDADRVDSDGGEITCGGQRLLCIIYLLYILDLNDASKVYLA
jgi:hypothetical protein